MPCAQFRPASPRCCRAAGLPAALRRQTLLALFVLALPSLAHAKDGVLTIEDGKISPETVTINKGEKLTVTNATQKKQWIWGQSGDWAFDFRSTKENGWTHEPGQALTITLKRPGKYVIGNAFDGKMHATVIVGP